MSSTLYWHRRRKVHIGQMNQGPIESERDRQNRRRSYFISRGTAAEGTDPARFYVSYRDLGGETVVLPYAERRLMDAQAAAQRHLDENTPKVTLKLQGRSSKGDKLIWEEQREGMTMSSTLSLDAEDFYSTMVSP